MNKTPDEQPVSPAQLGPGVAIHLDIVSPTGNPRDAAIRWTFADPRISTSIVLGIEEAAQLLAQLPKTLGAAIREAKQARSGLVVAEAVPRGPGPHIHTAPRNGHTR